MKKYVAGCDCERLQRAGEKNLEKKVNEEKLNGMDSLSEVKRLNQEVEDLGVRTNYYDGQQKGCWTALFRKLVLLQSIWSRF